MKPILFVVGLVLIALTACGPSQFTVSDPWARPAMARSTGAAYFVIENPGAADTLLSAASDVAETVELHKTVMQQNGVMQMVQMERIVISANGKTEFKPGGSHIMLINLKREIKTGDTFALSLEFQNAGKINLQVKVQER